MDDAFSHWFERLDRDGYLDAELILNELFIHAYPDGHACRCSCHPTLGSPQQHGDHGCPCTQSDEDRRDRMTSWFAEMDAAHAEWETSDEGRADSARHAAEAAEVDAWAAADPGIEISHWGGCHPEQWEGSIDGHSFYFHEKRGRWRIEIDLAPTGETYRRLVADPDVPKDDDGLRTVEEPIERGAVIAEGFDHDLGVTPLHHGRFIANTVRTHLRREGCPHPGARRFCPECGAQVAMK